MLAVLLCRSVAQREALVRALKAARGAQLSPSQAPGTHTGLLAHSRPSEIKCCGLSGPWSYLVCNGLWPVQKEVVRFLCFPSSSAVPLGVVGLLRAPGPDLLSPSSPSGHGRAHRNLLHPVPGHSYSSSSLLSMIPNTVGALQTQEFCAYTDKRGCHNSLGPDQRAATLGQLQKELLEGYFFFFFPLLFTQFSAYFPKGKVVV